MTEPTSSLPKASLPTGWPEPEALGFGAYLAPYLVHCSQRGSSGWSGPRVDAREQAPLPVASGGLQYGLSVFEGLKAYRGPDGALHLFRPREHARRLQASARRLSLPEVPEELFLDACRIAVQVHEALVPPHGRGSLYLRPTLYADEEGLGLKLAAQHGFSVVATPCSDPPLKTLRLWAEPELIRAAPGGLGAAKTAANYAAGLGGLLRARERGYDDVIWLDATERRMLGEAGTMNLFVQIGEQLLTPPLDGTILAGVTRDSLLSLLRDQGIDARERAVSLDELADAERRGRLGCAFGCGTAARIVRIAEIGDHWRSIRFADNGFPTALAARLKSVQEAGTAEHADWRIPVAGQRPGGAGA
jgi:branched-chain amino acid aminotransferase